jgi:hypothetical protein
MIELVPIVLGNIKINKILEKMLNIPLINYCDRCTLRYSILDFRESQSNDIGLTSRINLGACTIKELLVREMKEKTQYYLIQCVHIDLRTIFGNLIIG